MSSNLVVVAIPEEQDRVWKISSEQVPHLTVLFLGDEEDADTQQIMQFVEHAVTLSEHGQFYANVDHRGTLGDDDADVLFFRKNSCDLKWIREFRGQLLKNDAIRTAYDSTEQYDEWTPHLTLGYPETPAKPLKDDDYPIHSVCFDRIAVWAGEFEGPEFRLEWPERELDGPLSVAYSDVQKDALAHCTGNGLDVVEHFGIRGMKWGINRDFDRSQKLMAESKALDEISLAKGRFGKKLTQRKSEVKRRESVALKHVVTSQVMRETNASAKKDFKALYKKPEFQNINYRDKYGHPQFDSPKFKALQQAESKIWIEHLNKTVSGYKFDVEVKGNSWDLVPSKIEHDDSVITVRPIRDDNGYLIDVELVEDSMEQTAELGAEFIEHFGTKGMRWGVRKSVVTRPKNNFTKGQVAAVLGLGPLAFASRKVRDNSDKNQADRANYRLDKRWEKDFQKAKGFEFDDQKFTNSYNAKFKDHDFSKEDWDSPSPAYKKYQDGYFKEMSHEYSKQFAEHYGSSPSGKYEAHHVPGTDLVKLRRVDAAVHSLEDGVLVTFRIILGDDGLIKGLEKVEDTTEQTKPDPKKMIHNAEVGAEFIIEHFGIKGMRWGFRREPPTAAAPMATSRVPHGSRRKTKIDVEGGENHPAHSDAIKVAEAKVKLKKSGPAALSNLELREVANRMQLENQVALLTSHKGKRFVSRQLEIEGQNLARNTVRTGVGIGVAKGASKLATRALVPVI